MSKAEAAAYKAYPYNGDYRGQGDSNSKIREAYINGYHQAENDLELTWSDIEKICLIAREVHQFKGFWSESVYQEVLKRFKDYKERKEK